MRQVALSSPALSPHGDRFDSVGLRSCWKTTECPPDFDIVEIENTLEVKMAFASKRNQNNDFEAKRPRGLCLKLSILTIP